MEQTSYLEHSPYPVNAPETNDLSPAVTPEPQRLRTRPSPEITNADGPARPSQARHRRKCEICHHPDRQLIEEDFLLWRKPTAMVREYEFSERSLYRHAHAFNLFALRRENLRLTLDRVLERGAEVENTGNTIIRAVRAQACLTDDNRWVEPAKRVIFCTEDSAPASRSVAVLQHRGSPDLEISSDGQPVLIDSLAIRNQA